MSKNFYQNALTRKILIYIYKNFMSLLFFRRGKIVFINSIPKAGTHLLLGILTEIKGLLFSGVHIDMWDIHINEKKNLPLNEFVLDQAKLHKILSRIRKGQILTGHLPWSIEIEKIFISKGVKCIFLSRNHESILKSMVYYISNLKRHYLHSTLTNNYDTDDKKFIALKNGIPWKKNSVGVDPFYNVLKSYNGWSASSNVFQIKFEDIIGSKGGGTNELRLYFIKRLYSFIFENRISDKHLKLIHKKSYRKKSFTLNRGKI